METAVKIYKVPNTEAFVENSGMVHLSFWGAFSKALSLFTS